MAGNPTTQTRTLGQRKLLFYLLSSLFAALTAAGAFIKIPLPYVPLTLQDFFVILSGSVLGPQYGALSQLIYLAVGLAGVPIFSNGGGPGYIFQPTFGYLLAYPLAAYVVGLVIWGKRRFADGPVPSFLRIFLASLSGMLLIFVIGVTGLYFNLNYVVGKSISLQTAVLTGFVVFIPGDLIKIFLSTVVSLKVNQLVNT